MAGQNAADWAEGYVRQLACAWAARMPVFLPEPRGVSPRGWPVLPETKRAAYLHYLDVNAAAGRQARPPSPLVRHIFALDIEGDQ